MQPSPRSISFLALAAILAAPLACSNQTLDPEQARITAIGAELVPEHAESLRRALEPTPGSFESMRRPKPGDWLAEHREEGQTFVQWRDADTLIPSAERRTIYLLPIGEFPEDSSPPLDAFTDYSEAYFMLPAARLPAVTIAEVRASERLNPNSNQSQILTTDILDWMAERIPDDAYCVIAVTMTDLYPAPSWNFVFGEARLHARVGVYSFARHDPRFRGVIDPPDADQRTLERSLATMSHEIGHMFGIQHCVHYECPMAGSNSLSESDRRPFHLCPVCLHKLQVAVGFDVVERYTGLEKFYERWGISSETEWTRARLEFLAAGAP